MAYCSFLYSQFFVEPPMPDDDFTGRTVIVTGANKGLGLEAARHLLRLNASKVILAVRSLSNGNIARTNLEASTGRSNAVQVCELDMADHESVRNFANQMEAIERLDAVILNAGIYTQDFVLVDGHESTITVNVINTFLLALLLVPVLRKSSARWDTVPRMSIVSSDRHVMTDLPEWKADNTFEVFNNEKSNMNER
jgi:retinol dehydrogenase-12